MLGLVYNLLGGVTVVENPNNNTITVRGVNGNFLDHDISKMWKTSKIFGHIVRKSSSFGFEFDNFFAVDLLYIVKKIIAEGKRIQGNRRQYDELVKLLMSNTWMRGIESQDHKLLDYSALSRLTVSLFEHQERFLRTYEQRSGAYNLAGYILGAAPGSGKALRDDTPVLTSTGWKAIGKIKKGELVATPKGTYTPVTGVFPQGEVSLYEVEFADGRVVPACAEHLWKYHDHNADQQEWTVGNTAKLIERLSKSGNRLYVPLVSEVGDITVQTPLKRFEAAQLVVRASKGEINSSMHSFVAARSAGFSFDDPQQVKLPADYLRGDHVARVQLIQGIFSQAASISDSGNVTVKLQSKALAEQVRQVLFSLGAIVKITCAEDGCTLKVRHANIASLFTGEQCQRALQVCKLEPDLKLGIKSIKPISSGKATCISVLDEDRLFITKDYIVTHNTITGIALSECLNSTTTFCIVPKNSVDRVWEATLGSVFREPVRYWSSINGDSQTRAKEPMKPGYRYYVLHYEQLGQLNTFVEQNAGKLGKVNIIIDESHNFNDIKSERTQLLCSIVQKVKPVSTIFASGTPVKAMGSEVIPIMRCIDKYFNHHVENRFKQVFGLSTARALDILANRMGLITFKVDKAVVVGNQVHYYDVDVTMPSSKEYTLDNIRTVMGKFIEERMKWYQSRLSAFHADYFEGLSYYEKTLRSAKDLEEFSMYKRYAAMIHRGYDPKLHVQEALFCNSYEKKKIIPSLPSGLKERFKEAKSVYKYYQLKVQGEALGRILGRMRTQCSVDMAKAMENYNIRKSANPLEPGPSSLENLINQGVKKTVIFTSYVEVVDTLHDMLKERGFNPLRVYGDTNKNLAGMIADFDKNKDINPCIATYPSLSTAVPLVMANQGVMHNAPFRIHEYEQAVARMDRIGQTETVNIFNLYLDTGALLNISTRSVDIMAWSKSQVQAIMGIEVETAAVESIDVAQVLEPDEINIIADLALESCSPSDTFYIDSTRVRALERVLGW